MIHPSCVTGHDPLPCLEVSIEGSTTCTVYSNAKTYNLGLWSLGVSVKSETN